MYSQLWFTFLSCSHQLRQLLTQEAPICKKATLLTVLDFNKWSDSCVQISRPNSYSQLVKWKHFLNYVVRLLCHSMDIFHSFVTGTACMKYGGQEGQKSALQSHHPLHPPSSEGDLQTCYTAHGETVTSQCFLSAADHHRQI